VYGLTARSDRWIPHVLTADGAERPSVCVRFDGADEAPGDGVRLVYGSRQHAIAFSVARDGRRVQVDAIGDARRAEPDHAASLLLGPVLATLLRLRRTVALHACVVEIGSSAVLLVGERGAGKSTLAAALADRGHAILADDVGTLAETADGTWVAHPGYPRLRLDPASLTSFTAPPEATGPPIWGTGKRWVELSPDDAAGPWRFQREARPVAAVYELRRSGRRAPAVTEIAGGVRVATLVRHVREAPFALAPAARADEFRRLSRLAAAVPVRRLDCADDLAALAVTCEALVADVC
jgi:hypothetical protein